MPELTFSTKGNAAVLAAYDAINKAQTAAAKGAGHVNEKLQLTAKEAKQLDVLQVQIAKRNETSSEKYVRKLEEAKRALAGHKNETVILQRETARLTDEYLKSANSGRQLSSLQISELKKLSKANDELKDKLGLVRDSAEGAFGETMLDNLGSMALKIGAVMGPVVMLRRGFGDLQKSIESARAAAVAGAPGESEIKQLADSQSEFDKLIGLRDRLQRSGAAKSRDAANEATFALSSAGMADPRSEALLTMLGRRSVVKDIGSLATGAATYRNSFSREDSGDLIQILSKSFQVAKLAPGSVEDVQRAIASVGSIAGPSGIRDEEAGAAIAVLAQSIGRPDEAATVLESLITSTEGADPKLGLAGIPLMDRVKKIQSMGMTPGDLKQFLGRKEAVRGFNLLSKSANAKEYLNQLGLVDRANTDLSAIYEKMRIVSPIGDTVDLATRTRAKLEQRKILEGAAAELLTAAQEQQIEDVRSRFNDKFGTSMPAKLLREAEIGVVSAGQGFGNVVETPLERLRRDVEGPRERSILTDEQRDQAQVLLKEQVGLMKQQLDAQQEQSVDIKELKSILERGGGMLGGTE